MLVYRIDTQDGKEINNEMRQIATELATLTPALRRLKSAVARHSHTIDSPSITQFRENLNRMLADAEVLNQRVSENSLFLAEVSEQASKHIISVEQHYNTILKDKTLASYIDNASRSTPSSQS